MEECTVAKNLLIGRICNNCNHKVLVDEDFWNDDVFVSTKYMCSSRLRKIKLTNDEVFVYPKWKYNGGINFDKRRSCEYWNNS